MSETRRHAEFGAQHRQLMLEEMEQSVLDLLIIGGGITGAGIALDAVSRGMKVALVEMQDFASGTSSRSTKLVHGGLRYLKQLDIAAVSEVGKERSIVYENGPHVTMPIWMLLPLYKNGTLGKLTTSIGLRVYDFLAGVKKSERRNMLTAQETLAKEPLLKREGLVAGGYYVEYRTDDARLTIEVVKKAVEQGALAVNYAKAEQLLYDQSDRITGVLVRDAIAGKEYELKAKKIVNATGPWVDELREWDGSKQGKTLRLTKGVHLVFDQSRFPLRQAVYFETPDKRMVFAIPRDGKTYFGTTDTDYDGELIEPQASLEDRIYLLNAIHFMFPDLTLSENDVESSWAGLRPLIQQKGKSPSEISRRDELFAAPSGLISIAGGKLTGYRKMAETIVDKVVRLLKEETGHAGYTDYTDYGACRTKNIPISGGNIGGSEQFDAFIRRKAEEGLKYGFRKEEAAFLARRYGTNTDKLFRLAEEAANGGEASRLSLVLAAQLQYAMLEEMTVKPVDFFIRRTGDLYFSIETVQRWKAPVIAVMAEKLGWSAEQQAEYTAELEWMLEAVKGN